jgi:hypothetical protein
MTRVNLDPGNAEGWLDCALATQRHLQIYGLEYFSESIFVLTFAA